VPSVELKILEEPYTFLVEDDGLKIWGWRMDRKR
jgi:hypothetical protein